VDDLPRSDTNITASTPFEAASAGASTLSVATLLAALASGDVTISTAAGSGGNGDITVASAVSFVNTTGPVTLSLIADRRHSTSTPISAPAAAARRR